MCSVWKNQFTQKRKLKQQDFQKMVIFQHDHIVKQSNFIQFCSINKTAENKDKDKDAGNSLS